MFHIQSCACITILVLSVLRPAAAFISQSVTKAPKLTSLLDSLREPSSGTEDFEAARQMFERLHFQSGKNIPVNGTQNTAVLPMTSNVLRLREMELSLLETLGDSDEAIDPLVELWVKEREDAAEALHYMIMAPTHDLLREEAILRDMIEDYEADGWVEPHGRLAVVLFTKGQYMEALHLCRFVLSVKPWHFEVAHLLLVIFLRLGAFGEALQVARQYELPPLYHPKRRRNWVKRFTYSARQRLDHARKVSAAATMDISAEECSVDDSSCWQ